jgi:hypothetical protein
MTIKRRLTAMRLDKIAAVDAPCQEHAVVAIVKRRTDTGPALIIKSTFREALTGSLLADHVREAFYGAFDNLYEGKDAFRTAVIDELSVGGDGTIASTDFKTWLASLIDQAVGAAKAAGAASLDPAELTKHFTAAADQWLVSKQEKPMFKFTTKAALLAAVAKFAPATSTVQESIDILDSARELNAEDVLPATGPIAKVAPPTDVSALTKTVERLTKSSALPVDVRPHYDGLTDDAARDAFLAKSTDDQRREMLDKNSGDPVIYKTKDGFEIRKSDGAAAAAMAKVADGLIAKVDNLTAQLGESSIEKRVLSYPNVAKGVATSMLKAADLMPEAERPAILATLAAMNKSQGGVFKAIGATGDGVSDVLTEGSETLQKMDAIVKRIAKADNIDEANATVKAMSGDAEYQELYKESLSEVPHVLNGSGSAAA